MLFFAVPPPVENVTVEMLSNSVEVMSGKGTLDDPYDMRRNQGAKLTCWTDCGHPAPEVTWKFRSVVSLVVSC